MDDDDSKPSNPLAVVWRVISNVSGVLALSSLLERAFDDLLRWKGFIATVVDVYRNVVDSIVGSLPFSVPLWLADYIVIGILVNTAIISSSFHTVFRSHIQHKGGAKPRKGKSIRLLVATTLFSLLFWPIIISAAIFDNIRRYCSKNYKERFGPYKDRLIASSLLFLQWLALVLVFVAMLLSINVLL